MGWNEFTKRRLSHLFFSLDGRIGRKTFWLAQLILLPFSALLLVGLTAVMTGNPFSGVIWEQPFAERWTWGPIWLVEGAVAFWPNFAVAAKRLHDRRRPAWIYLFVAPVSLASDIVLFLGYGGTGDIPSRLWSTASTIALIVLTWLLIELGFLRGRRGSNRYGADPLPPNVKEDPRIWRWLFSFRGRLSRSQWWLGMGLAAVFFLVLRSLELVVLDVIFTHSGVPLEKWDDDTWLTSAAALPYVIAAFVVMYTWPFAVAPLSLWQVFALAVKRLHDRDMTGWRVIFFPVLFLVAASITVVWRVISEDPATEVLYLPMWAAWTFFGLAAIWYVAQLGVLRGSRGTNRFGPDPSANTT